MQTGLFVRCVVGAGPLTPLTRGAYEWLDLLSTSPLAPARSAAAGPYLHHRLTEGWPHVTPPRGTSRALVTSITTAY